MTGKGLARLTAAAAIAVVVAAIAVPGASGAESAPAAAPVRGVTDTTIKVGGLGQLIRYPGAQVGASARFQRANNEGGVNGRTFDYVGMRDDTGAAETGKQVATSLVQTDQVFAIVPVITPDLAVAPDLVSQHVPYFGWAVSSNFCGNDWGFSFTGCTFPPGGVTTSNVWGLLVKQMFGDASAGKTATVVTENTDSGKYFLTTVTAGVKSAGLNVVSSTSPLPVPAVADYGALAQAVLTSNAGAAPDAVFVMASYPNVAQLHQAMRNAGYAGQFTSTVEYEPDLVAAATGGLVLVPTAPTESAPTNPAVAQMIADVTAIAPGVPIDQSVAAGYWSA
ncbi:MAG TPA: ABC transporter substrate-binding protein, partial [Acidimicrobiia bacterium]|nr:ABC transporter substrate-binding protein [Acidimicrobiia bacterium]